MRSIVVAVFLTVALFLGSEAAEGGENDLVKEVPGLVFKTNYSVYSGYLYANTAKTWKLHYMLTESKHDPKNDPLLFWFNGGPGCNSFSGAFEELGPFYVSSDGTTLFENVFSWNAHANVLYLESPIGTGFSYDTTNLSYSVANDAQSLDQHYNGIVDFFNRSQTKYKDRDFYLSGESYAGVYLPMLAAKIAQNLNKGFPNKNFKGVAIGNGFMNVNMLSNSLVRWSFYHGRIDEDDWETLKSTKCCVKSTFPPVKSESGAESCDWTSHLQSDNGIDFRGNNDECGQILNPIINASGIYTTLDPYNYYEDCYAGAQITYKQQRPRRRQRRAASDSVMDHNMGDLINRNSTDPLWGYPCWQENYVGKYMNNVTVQDAFHIDPIWRTKNTFSDCNMALYNQYKITVKDTTSYFNTILANVPKGFKILIYNGDVDTVCNFLGDMEFIHGIAQSKRMTEGKRARWFFRGDIAGFAQRFTTAAKSITIDVVTVKGAGHMVPLDRPGPSQQMITNFMFDLGFNSTDMTNPLQAPAPLISTGGGKGAAQFVPSALLVFTCLLAWTVVRFE